MLRLATIILSLALLAPFQALAADGPPASKAVQKLTERTIDDLFADLPKMSGSPQGRAIEAEILRRFNQSGSATADLLLSWAIRAMAEKNNARALDILDQIIVLKPEFAEAWNKRATVYYMMDDYGSSLSDIRQTLAREPRHFGALAGLGMILQALGKKDDAILAFRRALDINPQLDQVRKSLEAIEKETAGRSI